MRIQAATATVALGLFGFGAAAVAGSSGEVKTNVDASYKKGTADNPYVPERPPVFKGTVEAKGSSCEAKRKVKVKGVGSDKTDSKGRFKIDATGAGAGTYKVKVAEREAGKVICKAAKTKVKVEGSDL
jgi:hypothetical protein